MRIETLERWKAYWGGYFWLSCPNCGRMFGGHEKGGGRLWGATARGRCTCNDPKCVEEVKAINSKVVWRDTWSIPYGGLSYFDPYGNQKTEEDYKQYVLSLSLKGKEQQ